MKRTEFLSTTRQRLQNRRDFLCRSLHGELALRSRNGTPCDEADEAQEAEGDMVFSGIAMSESREIAAIDQALDRLVSGQYGVCESCEHKIPLQRLQAVPFATLCIRCQRETETGEDRHLLLSRHPFGGRDHHQATTRFRPRNPK